MTKPEERAVSACELLLETAERIAQRRRESGHMLSTKEYTEYFALCYIALQRQLPGLVSEQFALLTLAGSAGVESKEDAQRLSDDFLSAVRTYAEAPSLPAAAGQIEGAETAAEAEKAAEAELALLQKQIGELPKEESLRDTGALLREADQVISACVSYVKKAQEERHYKFTDAKHVQYYAYFLNLLLRSGLPMGDAGKSFFQRAAKAVGADTPSRQAAMEYKFYRALAIFNEQFQKHPPKEAVELSIAFIEKGRLSAGHVDKAMLLSGSRATEILQKAISDLQ